MERYEYKHASCSFGDISTVCNSNALSGWRVVAMTQSGHEYGTYTLLFERIRSKEDDIRLTKEDEQKLDIDQFRELMIRKQTNIK